MDVMILGVCSTVIHTEEELEQSLYDVGVRYLSLLNMLMRFTVQYLYNFTAEY